MLSFPILNKENTVTFMKAKMPIENNLKCRMKNSSVNSQNYRKTFKQQ